MCPKSIEELKENGAVDAPLFMRHKGRRGPRGPRLTRIWTVPSGRAQGAICSYSVPASTKGLEKARKNYLNWEKQRRELEGETSDGIYCGMIYNTQAERPPTKDPEKMPATPLFEVTDSFVPLNRQEFCSVCKKLSSVIKIDFNGWSNTYKYKLFCGHIASKEVKV